MDPEKCYKRMTFCPFYKDCSKTCDRALTKWITKEAQKEDLFVCQYMDRPECFKEVKDA